MISGQEKKRSWWSGLGVCWILLTALSLRGADTQPPTITFFDLNQSVAQEFPNKIQFAWQKVHGLTYDFATSSYVSNYIIASFPTHSNWFYTVWYAGTVNSLTWTEYPVYPAMSIRPSRINGANYVVLAIDGGKRFYQIRANPGTDLIYGP